MNGFVDTEHKRQPPVTELVGRYRSILIGGTFVRRKDFLEWNLWEDIEDGRVRQNIE